MQEVTKGDKVYYSDALGRDFTATVTEVTTEDTVSLRVRGPHNSIERVRDVPYALFPKAHTWHWLKNVSYPVW